MPRALCFCLALATLTRPSTAVEPPPSAFHQNLAFSADGKRLAYSAMVGDTWRVYVAEVATLGAAAPGKAISPPDQDCVWVDISRDGQKLVWALDRQDGSSDLVLARAPDGANATMLTYASKRNTYPAFSPDGKLLAFSSNRTARPAEEPTSLAGAEGSRSNRSGGRMALWTMGSDGSSPKPLAADAESDLHNPAWSPDGRWIVFYTDRRDGRDQIEIVSVDGSARRRLTDGKDHFTFPSFHPDGKSVIATRSRADTRELVRIDVATGAVLPLPGPAGFFTRVSPDGKRLATILGRYPATRIELADVPATPRPKP